MLSLETDNGQGPQGTPREVELKFDLDAKDVSALLDHPLLRDCMGEARRTVSTYYDTRKNALGEAGVSLRVRKRDGGYIQTVKSSDTGSAGLFDRWEWEEAIDGPDPDLDRVATFGGQSLPAKPSNGKLRAISMTLVDRRTCIIERGDARIEIVIDQGEVVAGKRRQPLVELELELLEGEPKTLFEIARELQSLVPLHLGVMTKYERGRRLANGKDARAMKAEPVKLDASMSAADAFRTIALACIRHFRANEPLILAARDPDALHQARVALRRLRSSFSLFRSIVAGPQLDRFSAEIRGLAAVLGEARNLDVLLRRRSEALSQSSRKALMTERGKAYDGAIELLCSPSTRALMLDLAEWVATGALGGKAGRRPVGPFSSRVLDRFWKKVKRRGKLLRGLNDEARHELRIAGKKLRYAGEFFASLYAGEDRVGGRNAFLAELEALQEKLGELNDIATERELAAGLAKLGIALPGHPRGQQKEREAGLVGESAETFERLAAAGPFWR